LTNLHYLLLAWIRWCYRSLHRHAAACPHEQTLRRGTGQLQSKQSFSITKKEEASSIFVLLVQEEEFKI
jgi:hypothetical protein